MTLDFDDIEKLTEVFATKDDLRKVEENMATSQDIDRVMSGTDKVLKEVIASRQELIALSQHQYETDDKLSKIEAIPVVAHALKSRKTKIK